MKTLYCEGCSLKVAEVATGSKLKKGMTVLCEKCETKRKAADMRMPAVLTKLRFVAGMTIRVRSIEYETI